MPDETTPQPQQQTVLSPEGFGNFCREYGELKVAYHDLSARYARLQEVANKLLAEHAPGRCQPAEAPPEAAAEEPVPLARRKGS